MIYIISIVSASVNITTSLTLEKETQTDTRLWD